MEGWQSARDLAQLRVPGFPTHASEMAFFLSRWIPVGCPTGHYEVSILRTERKKPAKAETSVLNWRHNINGARFAVDVSQAPHLMGQCPESGTEWIRLAPQPENIQFRTEFLPFPLRYELGIVDQIPVSMFPQHVRQAARGLAAIESLHHGYSEQGVYELTLLKKLFEFASSARRRLLMKAFLVLTRDYPYLSMIPEERWFTPSILIDLKLEGMPLTDANIRKVGHRASIALTGQTRKQPKFALNWSALPPAARRDFSIRHSNALRDIGGRYPEPGFVDLFIERLLRRGLPAAGIADARKALVERINLHMSAGHSLRSAIKNTISDATADPAISIAARQANAKRRGLSERSLMRWYQAEKLVTARKPKKAARLWPT